MNAWHDIPVGDDQPKVVNAVIEIPKDSHIKYEIDKDCGLLKLDRYYFSAVTMPGDYGFIPQTYCDDGDPLDIVVITHRPTHPMTLCEVKVLGAIKMVDGGEQDDKIIGVHAVDPRYSRFDSIDDLPPHFLEEIKQFFNTYKQLEKKDVQVKEVLSKEDAYQVIQESIELYNKDIRK